MHGQHHRNRWSQRSKELHQVEAEQWQADGTTEPCASECAAAKSRIARANVRRASTLTLKMKLKRSKGWELLE